MERVMRGVARETRESAAWQDRGEPVEDRTVECLTWTVGDDEGAHRREEKSDRRRANNRKYERESRQCGANDNVVTSNGDGKEEGGEWR